MSSKGIAIIYDRASTKKQENNYTRQDVKRIGSEIAAYFGFAAEAEPRFEVKSGEELKNRPVMLDILNTIKEGKRILGLRVAAIVVPNFTRLSRDEDIIDGLVIKKTCHDNQVVVIDFNRKVYDFERDNDQDAAFLELWFGARDKRQIMQNTTRGLKERASQGKFMGGIAPLGYRIVPSGELNRQGKPLTKMEIDPDEAELVRRIFQLYKTRTARQVAAEFNKNGILLPLKQKKNARRESSKQTKHRVFLPTDIVRVISNPIYAGWAKWNAQRNPSRPKSKYMKDFDEQMHYDLTLQIVSQTVFDRAQQIRKQRATMPARAVASRFAFTSILKCANCGGSMRGDKHFDGKRSEIRRYFYRCGVIIAEPHKCQHGQSISSYLVAKSVIPLMVQLLGNGQYLVKVLTEAARELSKSSTVEQLEAETRAELEKVTKNLERVVESISEGLLQKDEARNKLEELRDKKERLFRKLQGITEKDEIRSEILETLEFIQGNLDKTLWQLYENNPPMLARIARVIFKPRSVVVTSFWTNYDKRSWRNRDSVVESYELNPEYEKLADLASDQTSGGESEDEDGLLMVEDKTQPRGRSHRPTDSKQLLRGLPSAIG